MEIKGELICMIVSLLRKKMNNNESVIITGSAKGLGKAMAFAFAKNGFNLILNGRNKDKLEETVEELKGKFKDISIEVIMGDIRDREVLDDFYESAKNMNATILVNNAAIPSLGKNFEELDDAYIDENIGINLIAQLKLSLRIYKWFIENKKGCIININSIVGIEPKPNHNVHSAAKWGLDGFSKCLRLEAKKYNLRVMSIYPTRIKTIVEYEYGMEPEFVAERIIDCYINNKEDELILDGRPPEFRPGYKK